MVDFSEGIYNISISGSGGNSGLCAGNCDCDAEFTAVNFERVCDSSWWFWAENAGEATAGCRGATPSVIQGYVEESAGVLVAGFVSYYDAPCQNFTEGQYSVVSRGLEFSGVRGEEDGERIVFHSDLLGTDMIIFKVAEAATENEETAGDVVTNTCQGCVKDVLTMVM